ncbi:unnamed protein product [Arabidopsis halleri]
MLGACQFCFKWLLHVVCTSQDVTTEEEDKLLDAITTCRKEEELKNKATCLVNTVFFF